MKVVAAVRLWYEAGDYIVGASWFVGANANNPPCPGVAEENLILFRARSWTELLARPQSDRIVLRGGQPIETTLPDYRELDDLMET